MRRDRGCGRIGGGRHPLERHQLPGGAACAVRRRRSRGRVAPAPGARRARVERGARRRRHDAGRHRDGRRHRGPGPDRRAARSTSRATYKGTPVDVETDPELYQRGRRGVPRRLARGPRRQRRDPVESSTPSADRDHLGRAAPLDRRHRVAALAAADGQHRSPRGSARLRELCDDLRATATENGIGDLRRRPVASSASAAGRSRYLASLFHPDTPNDTAPSAIQRRRATARPADQPPRAELIATTGFRWAE